MDINRKTVEIQIRQDGGVVWINTKEDGCVCRICGIKELVLIDGRQPITYKEYKRRNDGKI